MILKGRGIMGASQSFTTNISIPDIIPVPDEKASWDDLFALCKKQNETIIELTKQITNLSESVAYLTRKLYGVSREKLPVAGQIDLFGNIWGESQQPDPQTVTGTSDENGNGCPSPDEVLSETGIPQKPQKKPRSSRKDLFSNVKTEKVVIPLTQDELTCKLCGAQMKVIGEELAREEFKITPMQVERVQYYTQTAVCTNCKEDNGDFAYKKSEAPQALISHSMASPSSVAYVAHQKIANAMTYYRMEKEFESRGIPLGRETMASWVIYCALNILKPLYKLLLDEALKRPVLHGDETWAQVLHEKDRPATSKSYIWLIVTGEDGLPPIAVYHYAPTRGHEIPEFLLKDYNGYFHTDKYDSYNCLENHLIRCLCWAHGRRKWLEAMPADIRNRDRTGMKVEELTPAEVGFLYCEKLLLTDKRLKGLLPEEKKAKRIEKEKPILNSFWTWLEGVSPLPGSKLEKAVNYFADSRERFENYLKDGRCSLTNNAAERIARYYVIGRKNFLFHNSVEGAEASTILYSIVRSALANNLDDLKYLEILLQRMPGMNDEPEGLRKLLPWSPEMQAECQKPGSAE